MPTYSLRKMNQGPKYHIFNSRNTNDDKAASFCGRIDYDETERAEGLSNLTRDEINSEYANDANGAYCLNCKNSLNS